MFLVNGLPVALVETKSPAVKNAMEKALAPAARYHAEIVRELVPLRVANHGRRCKRMVSSYPARRG